MLARARTTLRAECAAAGRADAFDRLEGMLTGENRPYADVAREMGTTERAIKVRVHRCIVASASC